MESETKKKEESLGESLLKTESHDRIKCTAATATSYLRENMLRRKAFSSCWIFQRQTPSMSSLRAGNLFSDEFDE